MSHVLILHREKGNSKANMYYIYHLYSLFYMKKKCNMIQTNWLRNSSTVVYLTSGYNCVASTPNDGSISKLVWSPFTNAEWEIDIIMFSGTGASARTNQTQLILVLVLNFYPRLTQKFKLTSNEDKFNIILYCLTLSKL